jgi:hypothetical protein
MGMAAAIRMIWIYGPGSMEVEEWFIFLYSDIHNICFYDQAAVPGEGCV